MKKLGLIFLAICLIFALVACSGGISLETGHELTAQFCAAISEGDYETAATLFHPAVGTDAQKLEEFHSALSERVGAAQSVAITIERYNSFENMMYTSDVGGARLTLGGEALVGTEDADLSVVIVDNEQGYGIYSIHFDP